MGKIWARGERPGSLCPVCGEENLRWHVWFEHLEKIDNANSGWRQCWCGKAFGDGWEKHMVAAGGHLVHYLACALNIGG